jgi:hypothetical protein
MAQVYGQVARVETSGEQPDYSFSDIGSAGCWCRSSGPNDGCPLGESRVCTVELFRIDGECGCDGLRCPGRG